MATHIGIGFSQEIDIITAGSSAALQAKANLNADKIDIALILSTTHYDPKQTVPAIREVLEDTKLIGCSTVGIIMSDSINTRGIAVLTIASDDMLFGIGSVENLVSQDIRQAGNILARNTLADFGHHSRQAFILFVDGHQENNSTLLKGIEEILGNIFPIFGAGICDNFNSNNTFQIFQDNVLTNAAIGLMIGGHISIGTGCYHGWRPLGKPRIVDEVEGNVLKSISGKKASSLYEEYFGDEAESLRSDRFGQMSILYPLGIYIEGSHEYLLRNTVDIRKDGSIVCQGDIPLGSEIHIMIGNKDSCKQAAIEAAQEAKNNLANKEPELVFVLESMSRLKLLGRTAFEEIQDITSIFGSNVPLIGMYTNGEISPFQTIEKFKKPYLLNESIIVLAIS